MPSTGILTVSGRPHEAKEVRSSLVPADFRLGRGKSGLDAHVLTLQNIVQDLDRD